MTRPTGELAYYGCYSTSRTLAGLDEHQVRRWTSWHRRVTLTMLAHALLAAERTLDEGRLAQAVSIVSAQDGPAGQYRRAPRPASDGQGLPPTEESWADEDCRELLRPPRPARPRSQRVGGSMRSFLFRRPDERK